MWSFLKDWTLTKILISDINRKWVTLDIRLERAYYRPLPFCLMFHRIQQLFYFVFISFFLSNSDVSRRWGQWFGKFNIWQENFHFLAKFFRFQPAFFSRDFGHSGIGRVHILKILFFFINFEFQQTWRSIFSKACVSRPESATGFSAAARRADSIAIF